MKRTTRSKRVSRSQSRLGAEAAPRTGARGDAVLFWGHKLAALTLLILSVWLLYGLLLDARFAVRYVIVEGAQLVSPSAVRQLVHPEYAGAPPSIFFVNNRDVAERIRQFSGCIESADVHCRLPDVVRVTLCERADVRLWESGGRYWWVDAAGRVLGPLGPGTTDSRAMEGVVVVHDVQSWAPEPDGHIAGVPWALLQDLGVALPAAKEYDYGRAHGLTIHVTGQRYPVYLGHDGQAGTKVAIMRRLAGELLAEGASVGYIDLRSESRPLYMLQ